MSGNSGVAAMVWCVAQLQQKLGIETLTIGREALAPQNSCTLEVCGRHLFYTIKLDGGWVSLSVCLMDAASSPELLMTIGDCVDGWRQVCRLVRALEESGLRSLEQRPIELGGGSGPDGWVIA